MVNLTNQAKWDLVGNYYNDNGSACDECQHFEKVFYSDTGWEYSCALLQSSYDDPEECLGFNYMVECLEDELEDA